MTGEPGGPYTPRGDRTFLNVEAAFARIGFDSDSTSNVDPPESDKGENHEVTVGADLYLTRELSIGLGVGFNSGNDESDEGFTIGVDVGWFVTPRFGLGMGIDFFSADEDEGEDNLAFFLVVRGRL